MTVCVCHHQNSGVSLCKMQNLDRTCRKEVTSAEHPKANSLPKKKKETRVKSNQTQLSELESTGTRGLLGPGAHKTQLSTQAKEQSWNSPGRKASMQPRAISPTQSGKHEMSVREQS